MREKGHISNVVSLRQTRSPYAPIGLASACVALLVFCVAINAGWPRENSLLVSGVGFVICFFPSLILAEHLTNRRQDRLALLYASSMDALRQSALSLHGRSVIKSRKIAEGYYQAAVAGLRRVAKESTSAELCRSCAVALERLADRDGFTVEEGSKFSDRMVFAVAFLRSALLGSKNAQYKVAMLYQEGIGFTRDHLEAYAWYNICAAAGGGEAERHREILAYGMSDTEISEAQQRSQELLAIIKGKA